MKEPVLEKHDCALEISAAMVETSCDYEGSGKGAHVDV